MKTNFECALDDLGKAFSKAPVWLALGWNDVQGRYNRSKLGVFWASISVLIFVSALGSIYSSLFEIELRAYMLHFILGLVIWNYVSGIILESGREFINAADYLVAFQLGYFTLLFRVIWRNFVVFLYQMLVFVLLAIYFGQAPTLVWLIVPVALLVISLNALWMGLLMSIFATRFRDLSELMNNVFRLLFFITPIMWMPGMKTELKSIVELNPFFHMIELFREPLFSSSVSSDSWVTSIVLCLFGWVVAFPLFVKFRTRLAFWL